MIIIPIFKSVSSTFTQRIELDTVIYVLTIQWNSREEAWYLSIFTDNEDPILSGLKLVPNYQLLDQYEHIEALPNGDFAVIDLEVGSQGVITYDNLGERYQLIYLSESELGI